MARVNYDIQLKELKNQMMNLGSMVEEVIGSTIQALVSRDVDLAKEIASGDEKIDGQVRMIEQECYNLLLRQQPIAGDLRTVSAALKMITDMERIGDHGADISELTISMSDHDYPREIALINQMSTDTTAMLIEAVNSFDEASLERAERVIEMDDAVDVMFDRFKESIADSIRKEETNPMQALDLLMVAKYLERIGDHATNIAEWVRFSITGDLPND